VALLYPAWEYDGTMRFVDPNIAIIRLAHRRTGIKSFTMSETVTVTEKVFPIIKAISN
jgi:hypothetical protein